MGQTFELAGTAPLEASTNGSRDTATTALVQAFMAELDEMRAQVATYPNLDPDEVLLSISGISGRLAEVRALLQRNGAQICSVLRTKEVDPLREELDLQFKVWSRRIALMEWEVRLTTSGHIT